MLRRVCSLLTAAGIYLNVAYIPTRLNAADDPTRDQEIRSAVRGLNLSEWSDDDVFKLSLVGRFRRWTSNWLRLCVLLCGPSYLYLGDRSLYPYPWPSAKRSSALSSVDGRCHAQMDFDATLGFPGEGPFSLSWLIHFRLPCFLGVFFLFPSVLPCLLTWTSLCFAWWWGWWCAVFCFCRFPCRVALLCCAVPLGDAMPIFPATPGDLQRANLRRQRPALVEGRPVEPRTVKLRERLLEQFALWVGEQGVELDGLFSQGIHAADDLNVLLCRYGRQLYQSGKTYNSFAETINAVATRKPVLRRSLQGAWDLGYAWVRAEPSQHHVAMPAPILCAMVSLATMWGWLHVAGCLALCWGALLRPGELLNACRSDLLLPSDLSGTIKFALLSIQEPKSRHTTARHQSAKVDAPDLLSFIDFVFKDLKGHQKLWPHTASTLRSRFSHLLRALKLPSVHQPNLRCLDLGSLRSGGATWIMLTTENADLCRRRGRWASHRMMEIYVQESMALQYIKMISPESRRICLELFASFHAVIQKAKELERAKIPLNAWFVLFTSWKCSWSGMDGWKKREMFHLQLYDGHPYFLHCWYQHGNVYVATIPTCSCDIPSKQLMEKGACGRRWHLSLTSVYFSLKNCPPSHPSAGGKGKCFICNYMMVTPTFCIADICMAMCMWPPSLLAAVIFRPNNWWKKERVEEDIYIYNIYIYIQIHI